MHSYKLQTSKDMLNLLELKELNESVGSRPRPIEKWTRALTFSPYIAYVHDNSGALVGFGRLEKNEPVILLYDMCVKPECQGQGVGTMVLNSLITQAKSAMITEIGLSAWTDRARNFYLQHGFIDSNTNKDLKNYMSASLIRNDNK